MKLKMLQFISAALLIIFSSGCGNDRQLQSISITPASATAPLAAHVTFTAAGQFSMSPMTANSVRVSWLVTGPGIDPVSFNNYSLTDQPFTMTCLLGTFTVTAFAPIDPNASTSGSVPPQVYQDLVLSHTRTAEGNFVASSAQVTCVAP